jgi:hypothetical protein
VRTLAHTVPLMLDSPYSQTLYARTAILGRYGDTWFQVQSLGRISRPRSQHQTPPFGFSFPPPGPAGPVPRLHRYYEGATTSCRPSRRTPLPSCGGTSVALVAFAPRRTSAPPRPGVGNPVSPAGMLPRRRKDLPSSWGISIVRLHMFSRRRQDCLHQTIAVQQHGPWLNNGKGSHERSFDAQ